MSVSAKEGVLFTIISPAGFHILAMIDHLSDIFEDNNHLVITSACDGEHSGPNDPHHKGEAYDVRTHDLGDRKYTFLQILKEQLGEKFYAFLEDPDTPNEHIHVQLAIGATYD
jgi:hypothetical protein